MYTVLRLTFLINLIPLSVSINHLEPLYTDNVTLQSSSTYHVVSDVLIEHNWMVSRNVSIIFNGSFTITVQGAVNIGCNYINTLDTHSIGITEPLHSIHIYNDDNATREGNIYAEQSTFICNTKFSNLNHAIHHSVAIEQFVVDNCLFENNIYGIFFADSSKTDQYQMTDNIFRNSDYGVYNPQNSLFRNNLFESIMNRAIYVGFGTTTAIIVNNTFINDWKHDHPSSYAIYIQYCTTANITFNMFNNLKYGVYTYSASSINVTHNTWIGNDIAIYLRQIIAHIHYNNFINNTYSIAMHTQEIEHQPFAGYNYYGTSSTDQDVVAQQISDICQGNSGALVTWYPWYTQPIDFNALPLYPAEANVTVHQCLGPDNHPHIIGNKLNTLYTDNISLNTSSSPYYVVRDVYTNINIAMTIKQGVEVIFVDDYRIHVRGILNIISSHIYYDDDSRRKGNIYAEQSAFICNTNFSNLYAVYHSTDVLATDELVADSNVFDNMVYGLSFIDPPVALQYQITNNIFRNSDHGVYHPRNALIRNNVFENIDKKAVFAEGTSAIIENNTFVNDLKIAASYAIYTRYSITANITLNAIRNFEYGIYTKSAAQYVHINYNTLIGNDMAISIGEINDPAHIHYNNFINNTINIQSQMNTNQLNCNYNWNGAVSDISNPYLVSLKIDDVCDENGYDAMITFWPYFDAPLLFDDMDNLPALYTFNFTNCSSFNDEIATLISNQPTRSPTSLAPTSNPTLTPTLQPTTVPTYSTIAPSKYPSYSPSITTVDPTTEPTTEPTMDPTGDPTNHPSNDPTIDPTHDPTIDPTQDPTHNPTVLPTRDPTKDPTMDPTFYPSKYPTHDPTMQPTFDPTLYPSMTHSTAVTSISEHSFDSEIQQKQSLKSTSYLVGIIIICILLSAAVFGTIYFHFIHRQKQHKHVHDVEFITKVMVDDNEDIPSNDYTVDQIAQKETTEEIENEDIPTDDCIPGDTQEQTKAETDNEDIATNVEKEEEKEVMNDDTVDGTDDDSADSLYHFDRRASSVVTPQTDKTTEGEHVKDDDGEGEYNKYEWIEDTLKMCDDEEWRMYLENFKRNKVDDNRLDELNENDWRELIPSIGPRNAFISRWHQFNNNEGLSPQLK